MSPVDTETLTEPLAWILAAIQASQSKAQFMCKRYVQEEEKGGEEREGGEKRERGSEREKRKRERERREKERAREKRKRERTSTHSMVLRME
jgi:sRNA-binding protein